MKASDGKNVLQTSLKSGPGSLSAKLQSPGFLLFLTVLLFCLGAGLHFFRGYYWSEGIYPHAWGVDDAYISFRYGWNAVHAGNLAWNESGFRKTEGFTNPLWVGLSALWSLPGNKDWLYPGVALTSVAVCAWLLYRIQKLLLDRYQTRKVLTGGLILALTPFLWADSTSGLESGVFGFVLALLAYLAVHSETLDRQKKTQLLSLSLTACLLRSDGLIYVAVILLGLLVMRSAAFKWVFSGALAGTLMLYLCRFLYYGKLFPNTAIAKLNFGVLERLPAGLLILLIVLVFGGGIFIVLGFLGIKHADRPGTRLADLLILLLWLGYFAYIGGDTFRERHLLGVFIYGAMLSATFWLARTRAEILKLVGVLLLLILLPLISSDARFSYWKAKPEDPLIALGKSLALHREVYGAISVRIAGKVPFFAGGDFVDNLGLNDDYLATLRRPRFVPGHSSGSDSEALKIVQEYSPENYSFISFLPSELVTTPEQVVLWVYTDRPADGVHASLSAEAWQALNASGDPLYLCAVLNFRR